MTKWRSLLLEGLLSTKPTPSSFSTFGYFLGTDFCHIIFLNAEQLHVLLTFLIPPKHIFLPWNILISLAIQIMYDCVQNITLCVHTDAIYKQCPYCSIIDDVLIDARLHSTAMRTLTCLSFLLQKLLVIFNRPNVTGFHYII